MLFKKIVFKNYFTVKSIYQKNKNKLKQIKKYF